MNYAKPRIAPLDLDASLACCGSHGGGCNSTPPPQEPQGYDPTGGLLGCYAFGTC